MVARGTEGCHRRDGAPGWAFMPGWHTALIDAGGPVRPSLDLGSRRELRYWDFGDGGASEPARTTPALPGLVWDQEDQRDDEQEDERQHEEHTLIPGRLVAAKVGQHQHHERRTED